MSSIEDLIIKAVIGLIQRTRGTCLTFTPKRVAKFAGLPTKPTMLSVVRFVIDKYLVPEGVEPYKVTSHGVKYIVRYDAPIWKKAKEITLS